MSRFDVITKACPLLFASTRYVEHLSRVGQTDHYKNVADAQRAITCGRGMEVDGRACRTEVAKVNRQYLTAAVSC